MGLLGKSAPLASTSTKVYTVPSGKTATLNINVCNRGSSIALVTIWIAAADSPANSEALEYQASVPVGGVLERTGIVCAAGERVIVRATTADCSVRVSGFEESADTVIAIAAKSAPSADTNTKLYTVLANTAAALNITVCNRGATTALVSIAIAAADTPVTSEYIEYQTELPSAGVLERTGFACSVGERVVVRINSADCSVRVHGYEEPEFS